MFTLSILLIVSTTTNANTEPYLALLRGTPDIIDGIICKGTTVRNVLGGFGCFCKPESDTFYEHDGKYCYSSSQILTVEGSIAIISMEVLTIFSIFFTRFSIAMVSYAFHI